MAVELTRDGAVATITINRPEALNAFNTEQLNSFLAVVRDANADTSIRVLIVTGAGDRAFIAGADIAEMMDKSPREALEFAHLGHAVCNAIESSPKPYIAAINGFALGGGCEIALACDIRVASERARIGQPEVGLGIPPGWGATQRLPRLVGTGIAKEMIYTGRHLTADEALSSGLVNAVYPPDSLMAAARELAGTIARNSPAALAASKRAINQAAIADATTGKLFEAQIFALSFGSADQREGMAAFLERRKPDFTGG
jgi:enoyl-CoA hydratase